MSDSRGLLESQIMWSELFNCYKRLKYVTIVNPLINCQNFLSVLSFQGKIPHLGRKTRKKHVGLKSALMTAETNTPTSHGQIFVDSLVGFLPVGSAGPRPTVVGLDDEGVLFLALTVHRAAGLQDSLSWCAIQHHSLEGSILTINLKGANLP